MAFSRISRIQRNLSLWAKSLNLHFSAAVIRLQQRPKSLMMYLELLRRPVLAFLEAAANFSKFSVTKKM
jgi:hypothetical protein